jgi:hypothetical protein
MMTLAAAFDLCLWCRPKLRVSIAAALIVIALCDVSRALPGEVSLWVDGENGSDLNDCTELRPCKEIQSAINKAPPPGMFAWIKVAGWLGTYAAVDLSHHKTVSVVGNCNDPSQVKVASLTAQDFVVLAVQCLSTPSVTARQHAVLDVDRVHFLETSGYHSNATVSSQINYMGGVVIKGDATGGHMVATHNAFISATSDISIPSPVSFGCFAAASYNSSIVFGDVNVSGLFGLGLPGTKGTFTCVGPHSTIDVPPTLYKGGMN